MSFRKEGLCAHMTPGACTDTELRHFMKPRTCFYSCPGSELLAGIARGEAQLQDLRKLVLSQGICGTAG